MLNQSDHSLGPHASRLPKDNDSLTVRANPDHPERPERHHARPEFLSAGDRGWTGPIQPPYPDRLFGDRGQPNLFCDQGNGRRGGGVATASTIVKSTCRWL